MRQHFPLPDMVPRADHVYYYCGVYCAHNGARFCEFIGRYGAYLTTLSAYVGDPLTAQEFVRLQQTIEQRILQAQQQ